MDITDPILTSSEFAPSEAELSSPAISPHLVEYLKKVFPVRAIETSGGGLDGAVNSVLALSRQQGQQDIINFLDNIKETRS